MCSQLSKTSFNSRIVVTLSWPGFSLNNVPYHVLFLHSITNICIVYPFTLTLQLFVPWHSISHMLQHRNLVQTQISSLLLCNSQYKYKIQFCDACAEIVLSTKTQN